MKTTLFFVASLLFVTFSSAQINPQTPWTWMKGDNIINQPGVYGCQGVAATANKPGARNFSTTWRDAAGNLWLFGGSGYGTSSIGYLNDLWKFDPLLNRWIWAHGDSATGKYSVYGTQGTANAANKPGAIFAGVSWTDVNHNLWLFGGFGFSNNAFGFLNSLWKYNTLTNEWTWVKGDNTVDEAGNYGVRGIESETNKPGARYGSQTWTDASGNLWLFGGYGYNSNSSGILNDIWKYNPSTNKWTWIKGDDDVELTGIYGTKGIPDAANKPGARYVSSSWTDHSGNLWLFGGYGYDENNSGSLNDLWKYDPSTNQWTWISGDKLIDQTGVYGTQGVSNPSNKPGARYVSSSWIDAFGELWMFGGYGYDASNSGYLNDLWKYNAVNNEWTWVKGDATVDQPGIYGTQGMPDASNKSGARTGSVSWADGLGNLWLFGGYGFDGATSGVLNDLWKISSFAGMLPVHLLQFNGALNNETVRLQWQSEQETDFSHFNIQRSFDGMGFVTVGKVNCAGTSNKNDYNYTDNDLRNRPAQKVFYRLQLMDKNGHFTYSKILRFDWKQNATSITVFPNPAVNSLNLSFTHAKQGMVMINITDMKGVVVKKQTENLSAGRISLQIDVSTLPSAGYLISVTNGEGAATQQKFIKQ
ncbi:MAG TPA: kelch repeat-containing protein [Chitinophagaceae bacterium]|nr:kelch repeat-containing protein [Chitinophagaceae bacterium]